MKRKILTPALCIMLMLFSGGRGDGGDPLFSRELPPGLDKYLQLYRLYEKWHAGLFGSRKFHEYFLKEYLRSLIGQEIRTDYDYHLLSPADPEDLKVACNLEQCRWLYLFGEIKAESLRDAVNKDSTVLRSWWRRTILLSVSGRVKKFRLGKDPRGDTIELYLEDMTLHPLGGA
jgi:hypothetical protein